LAESWALPILTHRRSDNDHSENWSVYYSDVRVGWIGQRAGVPIDVDQWG
jgi:fructosamine-3-kinase